MKFSNTSYQLPVTSYQSGQTVLMLAMLFVFISTAVIMGLAVAAANELRSASNFMKSVGSYYASESGVEDVAYRLRNAKVVTSPEVLVVNSATITTTIANVGSDKELIATSDLDDHIRKVKALLTVTAATGGVSFNYGVQVGNGGFFLENNSEIKGNVYSNGPITGQNNNIIRGDAVSAGAGGLFDNAHATGTVRAHEIKSSTIDKDAYYVVWGSGNTITGTQYPGSADQPTIPLPITDAQISDWETEAAAGGTISSPCPYNISAATTIGPKKIACDLIIDINPAATVTLTGPLWVTGNIVVQNNSILQVAASLPGKSVVIVADNPSNKLTSSKITLQNDTIYNGSGSGSYIFFVSQNNSYELGGSEVAINGKNNVSGSLVLYGGHGEILIENGISLKEVTGYRIHSKNNTVVTYESGLASPLFTSGPAGSLSVQSWREVK